MKVFWSWQADYAGEVGKVFVREALEDALKTVAADLELEESERPEVDHDVKGTAGMVDIAATILGKIENAAVFVADVSTVAKRQENGRHLQNPNVLFELGYAMKALGPEQVLLVANTAHLGGRPEDLPFDIRHRSGPVTYRLRKQDDPAKRAEVHEALVSELAVRLGAILKHVRGSAPPASSITPRAPGADRSVWFSADAKLEHRDLMRKGQMHELSIWPGPCGYMRIIPAGWPKEAPTAHEIERIPTELRPQPLGAWSNGNSGPNSLGFLWRDILSRRDLFSGKVESQSTIATATQWFDETGELWGFDRNILAAGSGDAPFLTHLYLVRQWGEFLSRGVKMMQHLGARMPLVVEAGATGLSELRWEAQFQSEQARGLKAEAFSQHESTTWTDKEQLQFLVQAYNRVRAAFALPPASEKFVQDALRGQAAG
ncbi:nucleotide-binding protein [Myxococcus sp. XM-1-1-1]|uniref:nucleotide-binding protein n=1 Tax=Myxococcus sp. XM-1-1-1 TaxID=2874602 RepID=UPI001CBD6D77|nr:nucleotide-binding protein [Myxococcus sp. XM-1-1-1]MBZ4414685.1 nucleotide-binding protein [Myxococcus sp. XM-1-1-1]